MISPILNCLKSTKYGSITIKLWNSLNCNSIPSLFWTSKRIKSKIWSSLANPSYPPLKNCHWTSTKYQYGRNNFILISYSSWISIITELWIFFGSMMKPLLNFSNSTSKTIKSKLSRNSIFQGWLYWTLMAIL